MLCVLARQWLACLALHPCEEVDDAPPACAQALLMSSLVLPVCSVPLPHCTMHLPRSCFSHMPGACMANASLMQAGLTSHGRNVTSGLVSMHGSCAAHASRANKSWPQCHLRPCVHAWLVRCSCKQGQQIMAVMSPSAPEPDSTAKSTATGAACSRRLRVATGRVALSTFTSPV